MLAKEKLPWTLEFRKGKMNRGTRSVASQELIKNPQLFNSQKLKNAKIRYLEKEA